MAELTFVLGGARSGKSRFAVELARKIALRTAFLATAVITDEEMSKRVERHRKARPQDWATVEEPLHVPEWLRCFGMEFDVIVIDCITIWLSNWVINGESDERILALVDELLDAVEHHQGHIIIVSNEVGMGIVPATSLGRRFRDLAGEANQRIAVPATSVYWLCAGIPVRIKGKGDTFSCQDQHPSG